MNNRGCGWDCHVACQTIPISRLGRVALGWPSCTHGFFGRLDSNCREYQATVVPCVGLRLWVVFAAVFGVCVSVTLALRTVLYGLLDHSQYSLCIAQVSESGEILGPWRHEYIWVSLALLSSGLHVPGSLLAIIPHLDYFRNITDSLSGWEEFWSLKNQRCHTTDIYVVQWECFHPI